ncbi:MAG: exo-alpha-sialidase [Clostridia bacterium]|nr:exo-alpha-sialidase [Clostridia bacterium]
MKKLISILLSAVIIMSSGVFAFAGGYTQPFYKGLNGIELMRIPSVITLNDGRVFAAMDNRHDHGTDSPQNIDTLVAFSPDGYGGWDYNQINYFDDCADGTGSKDSACFIDPVILQSARTGRIFVLVDAFADNTGCMNAAKDTGFTPDGHLKLNKNGKESAAYVGDYENGFAPVIEGGQVTAYSVDSEYRLYLDGEPLTMKQINSESQIQQSVFYSDVYEVVHTSYLWLRYSDDGGESWSAPVILNNQVKNEGETFLGTCPGRGIAVEYGGGERLIFTVYTYDGGIEHTSTVYSDDNGESWNRGEVVQNSLFAGKTSESQIIELPDGSLRMFSRNKSHYVTTCDSADGGVKWTKSKADINLDCTANCMVSFINLSRKSDGRSMVAASFACDKSGRANGVVRTGVINENGSISWGAKYRVNKGFFAYSCLTELTDGRLALLYEDEAAHISYMILDIAGDGSLSEINGNNCADSFDEPFLPVRNFFAKILAFFGLL